MAYKMVQYILPRTSQVSAKFLGNIDIELKAYCVKYDLLIA